MRAWSAAAARTANRELVELVDVLMNPKFRILETRKTRKPNLEEACVLRSDHRICRKMEDFFSLLMGFEVHPRIFQGYHGGTRSENADLI